LKSRRIRSMTVKLSAAVVLSLAIQTSASAFAEQSNPVPFDAPAAFSSTVSKAAVPFSDPEPLLSDGPQNATEVISFLDRFFASDAIILKAGAVSISIVRDGHVLATKGYGVVDKTAKGSINPEQTTFRIASVSKVFTAAAIMQLVDQGKLSLDDNIEKFLDGYQLTNPFNKPVTIANLLTHTTGFEVRDPDSSNFLIDPKAKAISLKDAVFANFPPVVREPGTSYMYDNFASRLQGYIVEKVSGESFDLYTANHLFKPLGMTSTSFKQTEDLTSRLAASYDSSGAPIPIYRLSPNPLPEGSMITTSADMAKFMNAFLNGGKAADGTVILTEDSVKAMSTYHMAIDPSVPDTTFGFEAPYLPAKTNGQFAIIKGGDVLGFSSLMWLMPENKTGIFVTYNTNGDLRDSLMSAFMDHYYSGHLTNFGETGFQQQPQDELRRFEGLYKDLRSSTIITQITVDGTGNLIVNDIISGRHELKQVGNLLFIDEKGAPLAFKLDEQGNVSYLKYTNPVGYAAKTPKAAGFPDIPANHPYASYIHVNQSLGLLTDDPSKPFGPTDTVSRGAFIHAILKQFNLPPSKNPSDFTDTSDSPYEGDIQAAKEIGVLTGVGKGLFEPDRPILREEAAVIIERVYVISGQQAPKLKPKLAPGTDYWALSAVSLMVNMKLYGPEVTVTNGVTDFGSKRPLNKQELAALQYLMLIPDQK
jgi:D-alanyl-D-alanine-carboxypeptidase/D-alanyl-D-alanine-endopeptidase